MLEHLPSFILADLALFHRALCGEDVVAPSALRRRRMSGPHAHARSEDAASEDA